MLPEIEILNFSIPSFGLCVFLAYLVGAFFLRFNLKKINKTQILYIPISLIILVFSFSGAHLFSFFEKVNLLSDTFDTLAYKFTHSGLNFLGGFVFSVVGIYFIIPKLIKIDRLHLFSLLMPSLAISYSIGRIGCLLSGDGCYGISTTLPIGMSFPNGSVPVFENVYPTPLFEAIIFFVFFFYIQNCFSKSQTKEDHLTNIIITFFIFGLFRFLIEFIRINTKYFYLSQAQWISLCLIIVAIILFQFRRKIL